MLTASFALLVPLLWHLQKRLLPRSSADWIWSMHLLTDLALE